MQEGHCPGSTSALWARAPGGLAAGVSDRPDGCDRADRRVAPVIYFWRLKRENATLTHKALKID